MAERLTPSSEEELREIVAAALSNERPVEVMSRGTKRGLGHRIESDLVVALEAMRGIELYEPAELVMSAKAGTPLAEIEAQLADNQQQLAFEPPDYGPLYGGEPMRGTIGGVFACNLSGPRRIKSGAARDHFLGVRAVTGRGDVIKSGGRVMKNVTGYDLCKLFAGSFGTLAAMTELTFKVLPAAEETLTLMLVGLERGAAFQALRMGVASAYDVASAAYLPPPAAARSEVAAVANAGGGLALLRLEGPGPSVRYRADALRQLLAPLSGGDMLGLDTSASLRLWREIRDVALLPTGAPALWRVSVPPAAGADLASQLSAQLGAEWLADWAGGLVWLAMRDAEDGGAGIVRAALAASGGHATLIRASPNVRARVSVFQPQEPPLARLNARVKESFDPQRILNPGRMQRDV